MNRTLRWLALIGALLLPACGTQAKPTPSSETAVTTRRITLDPGAIERLGIRVARPTDGDLAARITVPGSIEYDLAHFAEVGPRLDGRLIRIDAKLGDRVKKGELLAVVAVPTLGDAQASALTAKAALTTAKKNNDREQALLEKKLTTAREAEAAANALESAKAEAAAAEARLAALGVGGGVAGTLSLVAPMDGVVVSRNAVLGGHLTSSETAFEIANTSKLIAAVDIHEADLPYVSVGAVVSFRADGLPERVFSGKIAHVDPSVHKISRLVRARVEVDNSDGALRPGMFVRASLTLPTTLPAGIVRLPTDAIQPLGAEDVAFVELSKGVYEVRAVRVERRTSQIVEVSSGVGATDAVVVKGAFLLRAEAGKQ